MTHFTDGYGALAWAEVAHLAAHEVEFDVEDMATLSICEQDFLMLGCFMALGAAVYPCLNEENSNLQLRMLEIVDAQRPEWLIDTEDEDGEE